MLKAKKLACGNWREEPKEACAPTRGPKKRCNPAGVPAERAISLALAAIVAKARAILVLAVIMYRLGRMEEASTHLWRVAALLKAFPLPPYSWEAEHVGESVKTTFSFDERKALLRMYFEQVDPASTGTLAELLGYDPEYVMPQLQRRG